jgi:Core-2/I-Branching enzyme
MTGGRTPWAAVVLAHADPAHLRRLIDALVDVPVFLHVDAGTPVEVFDAMVHDLPARVVVLPRRRTTLSSWSLVAAELSGLRAAVAGTRAEHVAVLSGADYPLVAMSRLHDELRALAGRSWVWNVPLPYHEWSTARHPDGGLWRLRHRFLVREDQVVFWRGVPLRWPVQRRLPAGVQARAGSQWKVLSRGHVEALLRVVDTRPDLVRFWRTTLVPDETFIPSVLASPELVGESAVLPVCPTNPWFIDWPTAGAHHPRVLTDDSFGQLRVTRRPVPSTDREPHEGTLDQGGALPSFDRAWFARKFSSRHPGILDRIDEELRA